MALVMNNSFAALPMLRGQPADYKISRYYRARNYERRPPPPMRYCVFINNNKLKLSLLPPRRRQLSVGAKDFRT